MTAPTNPANDELDLLACCLLGANPHTVNVTPDDFYEPWHGELWQAILDTSSDGRTSPDLVRHQLGHQGNERAVQIVEIYARPVIPLNAPVHAQRVVEAAHLRHLQGIATGLMQRATTPDTNPAAIDTWLRTQLETTTRHTTHTTVTPADVLPTVIDQIQNGRQMGLPTPWPSLDRHIHGLSPDRLYIVGARPGVGKSLLGQNLAVHWSKHHQQPTLFASLEMSAAELTTRALAQASRVNLSTLIDSRLSEQDWQRLTPATERLAAAQIHIADQPHQTIDTIRTAAHHQAQTAGLGLVIVDYLQLVAPRDRRIPREQQVSEISRGLKLLAKELHVPVVAMAQIRRAYDGERNRRPALSDLRESGAIEQDADAVLLLHIPDPEQPWDAELIVAKARAGERGVVPLHMLTHWATIANPAHNHHQEAA